MNFIRVSEDPGIPQGRPPDHNAVASRLPEQGRGVLGGFDVPVSDDGNPQGRLDLGDHGPLGAAAEPLGGRPRVDGDGVGAFLLGNPGDLEGVFLLRRPARPDCPSAAAPSG